ncbi:MAG: surE [Nitrospira sp.]|nr:surE [Nitrospira sp.]
MTRARILVTNDDGVTSHGIHAVAVALRSLGEVWVVAPDRERTAMGHAVTLHKPLRITKIEPRVFAVNGTPVDCINLALAKVLPRRPALIVSGINKGVNLGDDVMYSGTVSAALEGTILGIPSMAVSQEGESEFRFNVGAQYAARVAAKVLLHGLPPETILNVNIPNGTFRSIKGVKVTCLSRRRFEDPIVEKVDPRGRKYYWIAGTRQSWSRRDGADHEALQRHMVSVTPIHLDTTHYDVIEQFRAWEPALSRSPVRKTLPNPRSPRRSQA